MIIGESSLPIIKYRITAKLYHIDIEHFSILSIYYEYGL